MKATSLQRANGVLLCGILVCVVLYYARQILIPVTAAAMLAMLMTPLASWLELKGMKRIFSTLLCLLLFLAVVAGIGALVVMQGKQLVAEMPKIKERTSEITQKTQSLIEEKWHIPPSQQTAFVNEQLRSMKDSMSSVAKTTLLGITGLLGGIVLIIVFLFLFMLQREKYEAFLLKLYKGDDPDTAQKVIRRTAKVAQYYLLGRLISIAILTALFTVGLLLVGVKNAFLVSFIAAVLTIVPYVGSIIGGLFPVLVALVTGDSSSSALWALVVVLFVQSLDNYFIEPYVVGGEVNISAFFTILILAAGGLVWGVAGMILFIPMLGIAKIVFDNVNELEPYGYLVGDQEEGQQSKRMWKKVKGMFGK